MSSKAPNSCVRSDIHHPAPIIETKNCCKPAMPIKSPAKKIAEKKTNLPIKSNIYIIRSCGVLGM